MSTLIPYIDNTGTYLKLLHDLFTDLVKSPEEGEPSRVYVLYEHEIETKEYDKPLLVLHLPEIIESDYGDDGRDEDNLSNAILIKVPKNAPNPSVTAAGLAGFVTAKLKQQNFLEYLDPEAEATENPEEVQATPIKWSKNEQGYEVTFTQRIRYGLESEHSGVWGFVELNEQYSGDQVIHELQSSNSDPS